MLLLVHRHHHRAAKSEIVLQRVPRPFHLTLARLSAQLPHQLGALRKASGAERMTLAHQAAGRVVCYCRGCFRCCYSGYIVR
jgi:hypothetical protein